MDQTLIERANASVRGVVYAQNFCKPEKVLERIAAEKAGSEQAGLRRAVYESCGTYDVGVLEANIAPQQQDHTPEKSVTQKTLMHEAGESADKVSDDGFALTQVMAIVEGNEVEIPRFLRKPRAAQVSASAASTAEIAPDSGPLSDFGYITVASGNMSGHHSMPVLIAAFEGFFHVHRDGAIPSDGNKMTPENGAPLHEQAAAAALDEVGRQAALRHRRVSGLEGDPGEAAAKEVTQASFPKRKRGWFKKMSTKKMTIFRWFRQCLQNLRDGRSILETR